jgi:hypothetical protein
MARKKLTRGDCVYCGKDYTRGGLVEQLAHPLPQMVGIDPDWLSLREHRLEIPRGSVQRPDSLPGGLV